MFTAEAEKNLYYVAVICHKVVRKYFSLAFR